MKGIIQATTGSGGGLAAALLAVLFAAGCASTSTAPPDVASAGRSGSGSIADLFTGSSAKAPQTVAGAQPDVNCPPVQVRGGASTLTIAPPGEKTTMTLKYQGEFTREARDCTLAGDNMVMRIGIQGRIVVGPAGSPGQLNVPLRIAVVDEKPSGMRPITTKFIVIPVTVASVSGGTEFTHVEDALTFPLPTPTAELDTYIVYVGFDPQSAETQAKEKPKAKPRSKPKPKPTVSVD
jgi:hypothetical protein